MLLVPSMAPHGTAALRVKFGCAPCQETGLFLIVKKKKKKELNCFKSMKQFITGVILLI